MERMLRWTGRMIGLLAVLLLAAGFPVSAQAADKIPVAIFYENACEACREDEELEELYRESVPLELREQYELRIYNIFRESNREVYESFCGENGVPSEGMQLPALCVQGSWLYGYDGIESGVKQLLEEQEEGSVSVQAPAEQESDSASGKEEDTSVEMLPGELESAWEEAGDTPVLVLFTTYSCESCIAVKTYLEELSGTRSLKVLEYNIAEGTNVKLLQAWFDAWEVDSADQQVPILFFGGSYLSGERAILGELADALDRGEASAEEMRALLSSCEQEEGSEGLPGLMVLLGAGFLAGFNPCSISMLLMLLSVILTAQASVRRNGLLYLGGKYLTYLALGLGIYFAASAVTEAFLAQVMSAAKLILAVLFFAAALLNLMDFWHVRKGELGKIRMQLPRALRSWNHSLIRRAGGLSGGLLSLVVLGLGVVISIGEFFCTGQIYMASILYLLRQGGGTFFDVLPSFLVYVTAMCIPTAVFLLIIAKTRSINRISEFMLRRMDMVKLLNAILFSGFAVYFLVFG